jgi:hypothetical protein
MQTQAQRDEKTIDIFTALLVFVGVVAVGGAALWLAHLLVGLPERLAIGLVTPVAVLAAGGAVGYLVRRRRPC